MAQVVNSYGRNQVRTNKEEKKKIKDGHLNIAVLTSELNSDLETPEAWNRARLLEQDISTKINHTQIKDYCAFLREKNDKGELVSPAYNILYENFVKVLADEKTSLKGLYEKVCYVRDRVLYRPSFAIGEEEAFIHTSNQLRAEIENLPDSNDIYFVITEIYKELISSAKDKNIFRKFIRLLWTDRIEESEVNVKRLGYTTNDIEKYKMNGNGNEIPLSFSPYITHLMELVNRERLEHDYECYWMPLYNLTIK
jgi:hypothetical protein